MHPFVYQAVHTEFDAIAAAGAGGRHIAGGTTLIDLMREEVERPEKLIASTPCRSMTSASKAAIP
jgi:xanthine dehydrogenase YagS FAD-binding subunit